MLRCSHSARRVDALCNLTSQQVRVVAMTSYDRYMQYVRSPPFYHHHQCQHLQHQLQQFDDTGGGPDWRTSGLSVEGPPTDRGLSVLGRQRITTPTPASVEGSDGSRRRAAPPAFTIDAILSSSGTNTGSRIAESTSGAEWSRVQSQQTTAAGDSQLETSAQPQLRGKIKNHNEHGIRAQISESLTTKAKTERKWR